MSSYKADAVHKEKSKTPKKGKAKGTKTPGKLKKKKKAAFTSQDRKAAFEAKGFKFG